MRPRGANRFKRGQCNQVQYVQYAQYVQAEVGRREPHSDDIDAVSLREGGG